MIIIKDKITPRDRLLRLPEVLKIIPIGKTNWYAGVKAGKYPQPYKLGERVSVWRESEIYNLVDIITGKTKNEFDFL